MSADEVIAVYLNKNEVNFQRQETGYHTKDEHDSKHIRVTISTGRINQLTEDQP